MATNKLGDAKLRAVNTRDTAYKMKPVEGRCSFMSVNKESVPAKKQGGRKILDASFAERLNQACEANDYVPALHKGRLTWVRAELRERFAVNVSLETVRKWFAGETRPRPDKMKLIAELLGVDEAWLSLGLAPEIEPRERKVRNANAEGAVNVLCGFIQMGGGHPSFPEEGGPLPKCTDLSAIIRGATYAFRVSLAQSLGNRAYKFTVPANYAACFVVGVVPGVAFSVDFLELAPELIKKHGTKKGGYIEVNAVRQDTGAYMIGRDEWRRIERFSERL